MLVVMRTTKLGVYEEKFWRRIRYGSLGLPDEPGWTRAAPARGFILARKKESPSSW